MKAFRFRQAYAMLAKRFETGLLPRGKYRFAIGAETVLPRVTGASLTAAQTAELRRVIDFCTYDRPTPRSRLSDVVSPTHIR